MSNDLTPVLVACGQITDKSANPDGQTPIELMAEACRLAIADSGYQDLTKHIDTVAACGLTVDAAQVKTPVSRTYSNVPQSVAKQAGIKGNQYYYAHTGGNTPQMLVNHFAKEISEGRAGTVLLTGGEALRTMTERFNHWSKLLKPKGKWKHKTGSKPQPIGDSRLGNSEYEGRYGLDLPAQVYPLFENALQAHYQRSAADHHTAIGEIFSDLSRIAVDNPNAWFHQAYTADEIITPSKSNRMVAYPYTKRLNSMIVVNQAAALVLTSVKRAKDMGIDQDRWVYLHGAADAHDIWNVSERVDYHSSPAMRQVSQAALSMANKSIDEIDYLDLYSCFPSAVQIACDEFGIKHNDERGLSLTGGMPYFGGPGNNYAMHSIAHMMAKLRENRNGCGLVNANGWYLTKHSVGIYSAQAPGEPWQAYDCKSLQSRILGERGPKLVEQANGNAQIETFTVIFDKGNAPKRGIVIGRLESGERFLAESESDQQTLNTLIQQDSVGRSGVVRHHRNKNVFEVM